MLNRKEEIFSEASKALKHQQLSDDTEASDGASGAKKPKTSVNENMPSFTDMMAYIEKKVGPQMNIVISDSAAKCFFITSAADDFQTC